jgi:hypothetical protein
MSIRRTIAAFCAVLLFLTSGCTRKPTRLFDPELFLKGDEERHLFNQIVDDALAPGECAILEGKPYQYLAKKCAATTEGRLNDRENKDQATTPTFERLLRQPNLFRGQVVVVRRCVIIEIDRAELPAEFGLPGYSVLPALMVNQLHELYELRIISPPGSNLYERLQKGIEEGKNPVLRVSGFFMKAHSKLTSMKGEPPWRAPLLVCPEPSIENRAGTYNAYQDLVDAKMDKYLPSQSIDAPRAQERLVVEVLPAPARANFPADAFVLRVQGKHGSLNDPNFLTQAFEQFKVRLPVDQQAQPSAVVVRTRNAPIAGVRPTLAAISDLGVKRLYVNDENEVLQPDPEKPKDEKKKKPAKVSDE